MRKIVVIGAGAAGLAAATRARRTDSHAKIVVLEASSEFSRGTCSLPYFLTGEAPRSALQSICEEELEQRAIELRLNTPALAVDPARKTVLTATKALSYDRLVVALGSRPKRLPVMGGDPQHPRLWGLRTIADAEKILAQLRRLSVRQVAVVGGGYVGLELTEALTKLNCQVTLFHRPSRLMRLHDFCHESLLERLQSRGVVVKLETTVSMLAPDSREQTLEYSEADGERRSAAFDAVCVCAGIEPISELLATAGARLGAHGGVVVNRRGETSLADIYAAGDGVELPASDGGPSRFVPLATAAARLGRVCGENAAGGSQRLGSVWGTLAVRLFDQQLGVVGQPQDWATADVHKIQWGQSESSFPARRASRAVLFSHRRTEKLLGGQMIGPSCGSMVDLLSLAVDRGMTLSELGEQEYSYNPPLSGLWHPFYLAARKNTKNHGALSL